LEPPKHASLQYLAQSVLVGVLAVLCPLPLPGQTDKPAVAPAGGSALESIKARADSNDVEAQLTLGWMYDNGEGVPRDQKQAFRWWLKAAGQGQPVARYNVGLMYSAGQGVAQDYTEAGNWWRRTTEPMDVLATYQLGWLVATGSGVPKDYSDARNWWRTAVEHGYEVAKRELGLVEAQVTYSDGTSAGSVRMATNTMIGDAAYRGYGIAKRELEFQPVTFTDSDGKYLENVQVIGFNPVSIYYRQTNGVCCGETRLAKLPGDLQTRFGYEPKRAAKYEEDKARAASAADSSSPGRGLQVLFRYSGVSKSLATAPMSRESTNIAILTEIVADYKSKNAYIGKQTGAKEDIYVCGDMAMAVWNQIRTRGIAALIMIGNVGEDMHSIFDANHAWVLAEVRPGLYLALETTGGFVEYESQNPKYYFGHAFANPKQLKEYVALLSELDTARSKLAHAMDNYDSFPSRSTLAVLDTRTVDRNDAMYKLLALLLR